MPVTAGEPRPYRIDVPQSAIDDLRDRLARTRWPVQIPDAGWDYGTEVAYLRDLCAYWRTEYDWYAAQDLLNEFPQFRVEVDGVDLHCLHVRGSGPDPFPLLLLHGWPGSVWEFTKVLGPLSDPVAHGGDPADSFDLVVASLPGFGFSGTPLVRGWGVTRTAAALRALMARLGYDRFGAQGGDWGGIISAQLGADWPESCVAIHVNQTYALPPDRPSPDVAAWATRLAEWRSRESAYSLQQGTKPDSLTVAQNDSPAGLAAWIVEKFRTWGDTGGDVESAFSRDDLLTNITIYWLTQTAPSAARLYYERRHDEHAERRPPVRVPTAVAALPREPFRAPRAVVETRYPVARWTDFPAGGHFAALEQPDALVADIRAFFRTLRSPS